MSYIYCLLKGIAIGISIAAPIGPISLLCIRKTLSEGVKVGLVCGLGASIADGIYGLIASLGLITIDNISVPITSAFKIVSGLYLFYLGARIALSPVTIKEAKVKSNKLTIALLSTFLLTLSNPMTIMLFSALLCSNTEYSGRELPLLVLGIFLGSCLCWIILALVTSRIGRELSAKAMRVITVASGGLIGLYGLRNLLP